MISVIVPVYNAESCLERAFNSLLNQTIGFENLEIIFIDDSSTDDSANIIKNYSDNYGNVKSIFLDKNSGSGGKPRNVGLNHATKDYVMFLDSDDAFMGDACETLYNEIVSDDIDIVSGVHTWDGINPSGGLWQSILTNPHENFQTRQNKVNDALKNFPLKINSIDDYESIIGDFAFTPKIYRKSFLEENSITFPGRIIAEDSVFLLNALLNANGIKYINKIVYYYYHERMGGDNKSVSYIHSKDNLKSLLDAFYKMYYLSLDKNKSEIFKKYLLFQKLEYFLKSRLLKSNLSVGDILELLIYSSPLFKLCGDVNSDLVDLYKFISNRDYENALRVIFGENIINQKDIKVISDVDSIEDECQLVKFQSSSWLDQFESVKPDLIIFRQCENEGILNYCNKNSIPIISTMGIENNCRQLLDSIKFKYVPYLKHIVIFYELDDLKQINDIHNHFHSITYPFKHLMLITSENNLFLDGAILRSKLHEINLEDNYYFCFSNLETDSEEIINDLNNFEVSNDKNLILDSSDFKNFINSPAISVIIPVYNVEGYLRECLDSVCNQNFEDIEIICVNDGSTDNSLNILKEYEKLDSRISIISKENGGLSSARNAGLKQARGKYIYFIDSDDYLELTALKELYEISEKNNLDMLLFKAQCFDEDSGKKFTMPYFEMNFLNELVGDNVFNYRDLSDNIFDITVTMHDSFFKSDLILDMEFPVGLIFEDTVFFTEALFRAQRVLFYNKYLYNYRFRDDSITSSKSNKFSDIIHIMNLVEDLAKEYGIFEEIRYILYVKKLYRIRFRFLQTSEEFKEIFFNNIQKDFEKFKEEYESSNAFNNLPEYLKSIFYAGLNSKDYKEFESNLNS